MRSACFAVVLTAAAVLAHGPRTQAQGTTFEVASVKRNNANPNGMSVGCHPGGRWLMVNGAIDSLIDFAYPRDKLDLIGAPGWVSSERYDVDARAAGNPECNDMRPMMRALLADRLKLSAHYESREEDIFALVLARSDGRLGPQLRRSALDCDAINAARREGRPVDVPPPANDVPVCGMSARAGVIRFGGVPISRLAMSIDQSAGRFVIDKTGLEGNYDFWLEYAGGRAVALGNPDNRPTVFTALQEQLGLKLQSERAVLRSLVIDHIERPTDN